MSKVTLLVGILAAVLVSLLAVMGSGGGTASADNGPHVVESGAAPDKCAGCHRIHTAKNDFLFKAGGTVEDFCYSCHGIGGPGSDLAAQEGTFYGDVAVATPGAPYGSKTPSASLGLRAGGFELARIDTNDPCNTLTSPACTPTAVKIGVLATPQAVTSWHAVDDTTSGIMWGNGAINPSATPFAGPTYTLECTSCHDPHGNGNYRILRSIPQGSNATPYAIPDNVYPKTALGYTTSNYFNMYFPGSPTPAPYAGTITPAPGVSILVDTSRWCAQCHTRYLARGGRFYAPGSEASRADSGDPIFTYRHTSAGWGFRGNPTPNPDPSATPGPTPGVSFSNRACITCHASHGSNSTMGSVSSSVPWPGGGTVNPSNDTQRASLLKMNNRGMCRKCHSVN